MLLPLSTVVGMDRCEEEWYASDNLCGLCVVAGRSWTLAGSPQAVSWRPWPWEEWHGQSRAWAQHGKCESDTAALCKSNGKDTF